MFWYAFLSNMQQLSLPNNNLFVTIVQIYIFLIVSRCDILGFLMHFSQVLCVDSKRNTVTKSYNKEDVIAVVASL